MKPQIGLRTHGGALALYGVLLVLPTLVLGFLQWHHIQTEAERELGEVPRDAEDAASRLRRALQEELDQLVTSETARPFEHYARYYSPDTPDGEFALLDSPLARSDRPVGVLGWYKLDLSDPEAAQVEVYLGADDTPAARGALEVATAGLSSRHFDSLWLRTSMPLGTSSEELALSVRALAASAAGADDADCLGAEQMSIFDPVHSVVGDFGLLAYREEDGTPRLVAHRTVLIEPLPELLGRGECLQRLAQGRRIVQGFFLDPRWWLDELPNALAARVLTKRERFLPAGTAAADQEREYLARVRPVADTGFESESDADGLLGELSVAIDTAGIEARYVERERRFLGVALMLALSLGTGFVLLLHGVRKDIEQARRTENFVAAVTHELRTPLSTIQLHAEMLQDGWVKDGEQRDEFHRRIVRETARLSTLVERVLEKARLSAGPAQPRPGDLCAEVARHMDKLHGWRTSKEPDLAFELPEQLPPVMLTPEAVGSVLVNLVENARKYAPVDTSRAGHEPIHVAVRRERDGLALEVADRGPGVPATERARVFEAFYRTGNESTRSVRGTGLGLHLVALHASSVGGRASVEERPGGGALFRVLFPYAPPSAS